MLDLIHAIQWVVSEIVLMTVSLDATQAPTPLSHIQKLKSLRHVGVHIVK